MKKFTVVLLSIFMMFSVLSCNNENTNSNSSDLTVKEPESSKVTQNHSLKNETGENSSQINQFLKSDEISSYTSVASDKKDNYSNQKSNSTSSKKNASTVEGNKSSSKPQANDSARAVSNDIGSLLSDGYVYYSNHISTMEQGVFKKKINSEEPKIKIIPTSVSSIKILGNYMYYLAEGGKIFRNDLSGKNKKNIDNGNYDKIEVAGFWIFAKTTNNRLYMIKTDGSEKRLLSPGKTHNYRSFAIIYGFNRGYFYFRAEDQWYSDNQNVPDSIVIETATVEQHVDYRSLNPTPQDTKEFSDYALSNGQLNNDKILYARPSGYFIFDTNKHTTKEVLKSSHYIEVAFLKDYIFYDYNYANSIYTKEFVFEFRNLSSNQTQKVTFSNNANLYWEQDCKSNHAFVWNTTDNYYELIMVTPDGEKQTIFKEVLE